MKIRAIIDSFLLEPVNAGSTAIIRILLGIVIPFFFYSQGMGQEIFRNVSKVAWLYDNLILTKIYFLLIVTLSLLLITGWKPRVTSFLLFVVLLPTAFLSFGQKSRQIMLFTLLSFSFLRCETVYSPFANKSSTECGRCVGPIWPVRLIQIQLSLLYLVNAIAKSSAAYLKGNVLMAMSLSRPNFLVNLSTGYLYIAGIAIPAMLLAISTVIIEYFLSVGFWIRKLRLFTLFIGVSFHIILKFVVDIYMLDYASMFLYLSFILPFSKKE